MKLVQIIAVFSILLIGIITFASLWVLLYSTVNLFQFTLRPNATTPYAYSYDIMMQGMQGIFNLAFILLVLTFVVSSLVLLIEAKAVG